MRTESQTTPMPLETTEAEYPAGVIDATALLDEHRLRCSPPPEGEVAALQARWAALADAMKLVPEGWTVRRVYPGSWDTVVLYRVHAPDGMLRAAAAVTARPAPNGGLTLGVTPMANQRTHLQGPAAMAAAAALALAAAHV